MKLYTTITSLQKALKEERLKGLKVGFVPTMGALHKGHLSLVEMAASMCDIVVVSIFVNPTQFNDKNDLANYPRTLESDMKLLSTIRCEYIFSPSVGEVYPVPDTRKFEFGALETVMEGKFRPGHFNGVAQVVSRLLEIVLPDKAFFGRKDFQQMAVINELVRQLNLPVEIIPCDIVREKDGLAMSSRNKLLLPEYRKCAPLIYQTLKEAKEFAMKKKVAEVKKYVVSQINATQLLNVEYFEIVDDTTLIPIKNWNETGTKVGCIAVFAGKIRLIDNIVF
ncbi:MAG: pantoate--beta-alanine ligase [Bacteroidia bacterium]|nr:pantoate--beta-alanine ligase [Bacteroidia bacterium]